MTDEQQKLVKTATERKVKRHLNAVAANMGYRLVSAPLCADMLNAKKLLTKEEFAWLFSASKRDVEKFIAAGTIKVIKSGFDGGGIRIPAAEVDKFQRYLQSR